MMKTAETNPVYQSQILPVMQRAETDIKTLILVAFLYSQPKTILLTSILSVIARVKREIPKEFKDSESYVRGLVASADKMIYEFYNKPQLAFNIVKSELSRTSPRPLIISNPKQMLDIITNKKDLWAEAKGSPNVTDYPRILKKNINELSNFNIVAMEEGKKPINIWQKAELDTRYEHQMKMLDDLKDQDINICYISSHPNCSKRCQPWQGKLVSLTEHSTMSGFRIRKVDGQWLYSLTDIMAQVDKYGYHNNIICGFNCRHRLYRYNGQLPPKKYTDEDVAEQRNIEIKIRETERKIRLLKTREHLYNKIGDKITAKKYQVMAKNLTTYYKSYCEKNGYAWQEYRIKI